MGKEMTTNHSMATEAQKVRFIKKKKQAYSQKSTETH